MTLTVGGLCEGYAGIFLGLAGVLDVEHAWYSEYEPPTPKHPKPAQAAAKVLAHRFPGVPNHGDLTAVDWSQVEPVDLLTFGWPCFTGDTVVITARGTLPIAEVAVGDLVLTHMNRWRRVLHAGSRVAPLREVRTQGAPPVRTTDDHPFYVRSYRNYAHGTTRQIVHCWGEPQWMPAAEIQGLRTAIPAAIDPLDEPSWPWTPWLVGRWVADGWAELDTRRVKFAVSEDKAEKFRSELDRAGLTATEYAQDGCSRFTVGMTDVGQWLVDHFGHHASGKRMAAWLLASEHRAEWLDGYLSGDGHKDQGADWAVSISRSLAVGVAVLGVTLGLAPQVKMTVPHGEKKIAGRAVHEHPWYRTGLRRQMARQFVRWADGFAWVLVKTSKSLGVAGEVWNLHVEEDNSYTADGLVVHNCQPWSAAGKKLGEDDERAIWPDIAAAIGVLRPRYLFAENVPGVVARGELARVLGDLARLGFDAEWCCVRASDVGAPHRRERFFLAAANTENVGHQRGGGARVGWARPADSGEPAPNTEGVGWGEGRPEHAGLVGGSGVAGPGDAPADPDSDGLERRPEQDGEPIGPGLEASLGYDADGRVLDWAGYAPAIHRWERVLGRPAPAPTVLGQRGGRQLNPVFVEFLMGLPEGWVTDVPELTRNQKLKVLGNGCVPQQVAAAVRHLFPLLLDQTTEMAA